MNFDRLPDSDRCPSISQGDISAIFSPFFQPNWHPFYAERLAVFPRSVLLLDSRQRSACWCWPDLATLIEDNLERQIAYYPAEPSARSLRLVFDKRSCGLHLSIYEDDRILPGTLVSKAIDAESTVSESP
jgi:hypothetical protein